MIKRRIIAFHKYIKYIVTNSIAGSYLCPMSLRRIIYNLSGHNISGNILPECFFGYGPKGHLTIGKGSYCNYRCFFDLGDDIIIGKNCSIAFNVTFVNSSHEIGPATKRAWGGESGRIIVEDGCWIGANCTIMPNVKIGSGTVIGAGSLVLNDCEPNSLYVGVPARKIKTLK